MTDRLIRLKSFPTVPIMPNKTDALLSLLGGQPVIPVIKIDEVEKAVPLARALAKGGLRAIEITLRTPAALDAIRLVGAEGGGSDRRRGHDPQSEAVRRSGEGGLALHLVSPGITQNLLSAAADSEVPLLPGAITPGEMMMALDAGLDFLKFFPAEQSGGIDFLKALASPFNGLRFCPRRHFGEERR